MVYLEFGMISSIFVLQVLILLVFSCSGLSLERCVLCDPVYTPHPQSINHQSVVTMMIPALGDCLSCRASFYLSSSDKNVGKSSGFSNYCMIWKRLHSWEVRSDGFWFFFWTASLADTGEHRFCWRWVSFGQRRAFGAHWGLYCICAWTGKKLGIVEWTFSASGMTWPCLWCHYPIVNDRCN